MTNLFSAEVAQHYCYELMHLLDENSCLDFSLPSEQRSPHFLTDALFKTNGGQMFGVMVCRARDEFCGDVLAQVDDLVILKAFSGQFAGNWTVFGWVPPLLDVASYDNAVCCADPAIKKLTRRIETLECKSELRKKLVVERTELSRKSLAQIYDLYRFCCADGSFKTLSDIRADFVPTGTGDCCAPKLLNFAFANGLEPLSLAEFYYGSPNTSLSKKHKNFYPPCDEKCGIILPVMLGVDIVYRDEHIVVVHKTAGLLSVPGRSEDTQDCVVNCLKRLYPDCMEQPSVHRLDMDTSGLMVFAFTAKAHRNLSRQFESRTVQKRYIALLEGNIFATNRSSTVHTAKKPELSGRIELSFRLDTENRPHQIYDDVHGKLGITEYHILGVEKLRKTAGEAKYRTRIEFTPLTGRTHQLRLHSAHEKGLGLAIVGDRLYGSADKHYNDLGYGKKGKRLMLQAVFLAFDHPATGKQMVFERKAEF